MKTKSLILIAFIFLNSCSSNSKNRLIIGAWRQLKNNELVNEQIVFKKDNTLDAQSLLNGVLRTEYTMSYKISADGKFLSIGLEKWAEIVELTNSDLKIMFKDPYTTAHFKKQ